MEKEIGFLLAKKWKQEPIPVHALESNAAKGNLTFNIFQMAQSFKPLSTKKELDVTRIKDNVLSS